MNEGKSYGIYFYRQVSCHLYDLTRLIYEVAL